MRRRPAVLLLLLLLSGCVYYNGMYNTRRLAGQAERADRDGRSFEATGLWGQVSAKAESLIVHHPDSKWAEEARLLRGKALARLGDCANAVGPLERVMLTSKSDELAESAALAAGSCRVAMGEPLAAMVAYARLAESHDESRRAFALYAQGRALSLSGAHAEGYERLTASTHPRAQGERAAALAGSGRVTEALAVADSLLARRDTLAPWDSLLSWMRGHDPEPASELSGRVAADSGFPAALRVRILLRDAEFWLPRDSARGAVRFSQASEAGQGTPLGNEARIRMAIAQLRLVDDLERLRQQAQALTEETEAAGPASADAARLGAIARRVVVTADSASPGMPRGDLRLFIAAESARDSLGAVRLAAVQFRRIAAEWPESPYAAKALLALAALEPWHGDSLRADLLTRYPANPYVVLAVAGDSPQYTALEDSLRRFALSFRPDGRRPATPRPNQPGRPPVQEDRPAQPTRPRDPVDR